MTDKIEKELQLWIDGVYDGLRLANSVLEKEGYVFKIEFPNKESMVKQYKMRVVKNG